MLVSVTLVLLMMTMFASIFSMATDSVSKQKGIAENDQRARTVVNMLKSDVEKRAFREVVPYYPGEDSSTSIPVGSFGKRGGYLYINCNNPSSGIDDILQFVVSADQLQQNSDQTPYFGAAKMLYDQLAEVNSIARSTSLLYNPNQPDADDGSMSVNQVAASASAEVSYFMRGGALYRRVMLLRDPLDVSGDELAVNPTSNVANNPFLLNEGDLGSADAGGRFWFVGSPGAITLANFQLSGGTPAPAAWNVTQSNDFWAHFDLSAVPIGTGGGTNPSTGCTLVGIDAISNDIGLTSLGNPVMRWGFNFYTGQSREHTSTAAGGLFIGRFLQAETSDWRFNWPMSGSREEPNASTFTGT
ncbi:MAG: hypothetical protein KDA70_20830, partial [Planctomycetaceae bacterium]|nr:hypothetical protein [Planctomycetaceae bacterium]